MLNNALHATLNEGTVNNREENKTRLYNECTRAHMILLFLPRHASPDPNLFSV